MRIDPVVYAGLSPEDKAYVDRELAAYESLVERNPLQAFAPHKCKTCKRYEGDGCPDHKTPQLDFFAASTKIVAAFAGNQFGKTTSLIVRSLFELVDRECLPGHLKGFKRWDGPVHGWIVCPTTDKIYDSLILTLQQWVPKDQLLGGVWQKSSGGGAWSKERRQVSFKNGSTLSFKTYEQHESTLGGATLHFVGYDEPPPQAHRDECLTRLLRHRGYEMFAMTPLKTNTGWVRREIYRQREAPHITVVKGGMRDNPTLPEESVAETLALYRNDLWRRAREFGDFIDIGGQIYPDFERCVVSKPWSGEFVRALDVVVSIDPGIRNAGIVFLGFDGDNTAYVFDELLLQDCTPKQYADAIKARLARWRLPLSKVTFVADPASRQRGQVNATTVMSALALEEIFCNPGQNDVDAGIGQARTRMAHERLWVSPACRGLRDEADDYAAQEPAEGKDDSQLVPIKSNDHRLDALRYGLMERFWDPGVEDDAPDRNLGWVPGGDVPADPFSSARRGSDLPMGQMM